MNHDLRPWMSQSADRCDLATTAADTGFGPLELRLAPTQEAQIAIARQAIADGARTIRIEPFSATARFQTALRDALPQNISFVASSSVAADVVVIASAREEEIDGALLACADLPAGIVIAPETARHAARQGIYLISVPKAGTHLLVRLAEALGYRRGFCTAEPQPSHWHTLEPQDTHTRAPDFLGSTLRRQGIRQHAFSRTPVLFIYRDPRDVLVSEAHYYHQPGNHFSLGYLSHLGFRDRLLRLVDDPWLLGSIRSRMAGFAAWLDIPNVIPIAFEELVGPAGGGETLAQRRAVWSIQLKLHIAGRPDVIAASLYDPASPTFRRGQVGTWREYFDQEVTDRFAELPDDFMRRFGYDSAALHNPMPAHCDRFRRRRLELTDLEEPETPILIESNVGGSNIVRYRRRFTAIPLALGRVTLETWTDEELKCLASDADLARLRDRLRERPQPLR
jgi:hypothetical protein